MTVNEVEKDTDNLTLTIASHFHAAVERVWDVWADPRQLEQWWGPPSYPATVVDHDLTPGGRVTYFMTGPDGAKYRGWWNVAAADAPHLLDFVDGFSNEKDAPDGTLPTMAVEVRIAPSPHVGATMSIVTRFRSIEDMEQLIAMGHEKGIIDALGQVDAVLGAVTAVGVAP